uniref:anthranilate synthase component 2 n=1 Tax=Glaucosphaera vacuolata TaxID=38265 RepID=UPI001FCD33B2|nr:anthranilate synthase component 2 [Glaucosphaera vacuolata]UNJ18711.1 anthranilate synthase component 2 [Glaucosphaera vacuolata]
MTTLIIDNYDSFTYNLVQLVGYLGYNTKVARNDEISIDDIHLFKPEKIIISPGPGFPQESGICPNVIEKFCTTVPILGVCLGHQLIGSLHKGLIIRAPLLMHGKISRIYHSNKGIFKGLPNPFIATRYHSLIIDHATLPLDFEITAWTQEGIIMGCNLFNIPFLAGIQFHPESLWTNEGKDILKNFLQSY